MVTKTVDIRKMQTPLEEYLSLVEKGTEIIFTEDDTPIARLIPITSATAPRAAGLHAGAIWISDDFDEPLPDAFWAGDE